MQRAPSIKCIKLPGSRDFWWKYSRNLGVSNVRRDLDQQYRCMQVGAYCVAWGQIEDELKAYCDSCGEGPSQDKMQRSSRLSFALKVLERFVSILFPLTVGFSVALVMLGAVMHYSGGTASLEMLACVVLLTIVSPALIVLMSIALRRGHQFNSLAADELTGRDTRQPILLLRSFSEDSKVGSMTLFRNFRADLDFPYYAFGRKLRTLADCFLFGPVVAVGKPGERMQPLGAARKYVSGEDWKSVVANYMEQARLIVVILGHSPGLEWEINTILNGGHLGKVLFLFPKTEIRWWGDLKHQATGVIERRRVWRALCKMAPSVAVLKSSDRVVPQDALAAHFLPGGDFAIIHGANLNFGYLLDLGMLDMSNYERAIQLGIYGMFCHHNSAPDDSKLV